MHPPSAGSPITWPACGCSPATSRCSRRAASAVRGMPVIGEVCYQACTASRPGIKDALSPQVMFTDLGLKYVGPIDGHDEHAVESALRHARGFNAPVIVHVVTRKGMGYPPAENDEAEQMHSTGVIDPETGLATHDRGAGLDVDVLRRADQATPPSAATSSRSPRRCPGPTGLSRLRRAVPGPVLRRRHRRAARDDVGGRAGDGRHCTRWWRSTRRSSTGPSTR